MHSVFAAFLLLLIAASFPADATLDEMRIRAKKGPTGSKSPKGPTNPKGSKTPKAKTPKTHLSYFPKGNPDCPCIDVSETMGLIKCSGNAGQAVDFGTGCWPDDYGSLQCKNWDLSLH
jgi:hypothetical protein